MEINKARSSEAAGVQKKNTAETSSVAKSKNLRLEDIKNPSQKVSPAGDFIQWSPDAELYAEGMSQIKATSDVRTDKVQALKNAIKKGEYKVDANAVAEKMLAEAVEEVAFEAKKS